MRVRAGVCVQCVALFVAMLAACYTGAAMAGNGPAGDITADVWLGLFVTVAGSLLAGYTRGQDKRISILEHEDRQQWSAISLIRETVLREHPSRSETAEHRAYVEGQLQHIRERLDQLANRAH